MYCRRRARNSWLVEWHILALFRSLLDGYVPVYIRPQIKLRLTQNQVVYSVSAMISAFGENKLMPSPEGNSALINVKSGYCRRNNSWLLARLLRDADHWIPVCLPQEWKHAEADKLQELHHLNNEKIEDRKAAGSIRIALRATVWTCTASDGKGGHDFVYWSGVLVALVQLLALGIPPILLYGEWFTIMVTGSGTVLAWLNGALPQWVEEKVGVRTLDKSKDVLLTEGSGSRDLLVLRAPTGCLDLEALAGSQRWLRHPRLTRIYSAALALCWTSLLITVAGWEHHTWYILGVGLIGMIHNIFVAGWERMPSAHGIPLTYERIFVDDKVMKVLWQLEESFPQAGASAVSVFFPGGLKEHERAAWRFAADRYRDWESRESLMKQDGMPDALNMPDSRWVDEGDKVDVRIFGQPA